MVRNVAIKIWEFSTGSLIVVFRIFHILSANMDPDIRVPALHRALTAKYGSICNRNVNHLTIVLRKLAMTTSSLDFLLRCKRFGVFPNFISRAVRFARNGQCMRRLAERLPLRMLRASIRDTRVRLGHLERDLDGAWLCLYRTVSDARLWNALVGQKDAYYTTIYSAATLRLARKFAALCPDYSDGFLCGRQ